MVVNVGPSEAFEGSLMTRQKKWRKQIKDIDPKALNKQPKQTQTPNPKHKTNKWNSMKAQVVNHTAKNTNPRHKTNSSSKHESRSPKPQSQKPKT